MNMSREKMREILKHPEMNFMTRQTQERLNTELVAIKLQAEEAERAIGTTFDSAQDWHDNGAYDTQQHQTKMKYTKLRELEEKLHNVFLLTPRSETDTVGIGNTIVLKYDGEFAPETFTILGKDDTHTRPDWISYETPLAKALMGKPAGSDVELSLPNSGKAKVKLLSILPGNF